MNDVIVKPGPSAGVKKNQSLRKALQILEGMVRLSTPGRLQDISRSLKIPQSTVLRFLNTFIDFGYIKYDAETSCYYLTLKLTDLGFRVKDVFPFQKSLVKYIKQVSGKFRESVSFSIEQDMQIVYIASEEGPDWTLRTLQRIGQIGPMHATGVGKLYLADYSEEQLLELERRRGLARYTDYTITSLDELKHEIEHVREQSYALDNEECEMGVRCIAVPVRDYSGKIIAAISLSAPTSRLDPVKLKEIVDYLKQIGREASLEFGWAGESYKHGKNG